MDLDEFSDDGFDDLPDNALQELEKNAISFTQAQQAGGGLKHHQQQQQQHQPSQDTAREYSDYGWDEDDDLDTSEVINGAGPSHGRPVGASLVPQRQQQQPPLQQQNPSPRRPNPHLPNPRWNPIVDAPRRPNLPLGARPSYGNVGGPHQPTVVGSQSLQSQQPTGLNRPSTAQFVKPLLPPRIAPSQQQQQSSSSQYPHSHPSDIVSALQQRVRALEADLNAARGEVSILRTKTSKTEQQHNEEVARLKKLGSEQIQRQERMIEAAVTAEKTASTELLFMRQDMREAGSNRPKRRETNNSSASDARNGHGGNATTPKKGTKSWGMADGFDEMEISSPSKGQGRSRGTVAVNVGERTPSKGKRKRPLVDSPITALEIDSNEGQAAAALEKASTPAQQPAPFTAGTGSTITPPFEFLQLALDHAAFHNQPPTFDLLSRFVFPSDPDTSLATMIFQRLPMMGNPLRPMQLLVDFVEQIISLWIRCFDEEYWDPIKYLLSLISFTFQLNTSSVAPLVMPSLTVIGQTTMRSIGEWRHRLPEGDLSHSEKHGILEQHIDTSQILSLLYSTSLASVTWTLDTDGGLEPKIIEFWRLMSLDSVMMLLTQKQKPADIVAMLDILATSSLTESLGPITDEKNPVFIAKNVIERVSAKLIEAPLCAATADERRDIRMATLRTLIAFAKHEFGAAQLASHDNALPRLVTCLSGAIDDLYDQTIPLNILPQHDDAEDEPRSPSSDLYDIISQCVNLIHYLVTSPGTANLADISQKLSVSYGGSQRYLIALGRLTFAEEDLVIEAGIESEVVEAAHELLEMVVTPDEGEIISEAFGA